MCSSRGLCGDSEPPANRSSRSGEGSGSGSHYALCALGIGLIALGVVMIVWTVVPMDGEEPPQQQGPAHGPAGNDTSSSTAAPKDADGEDKDMSDGMKTSTVAYVLVGAGVIMLLLAICLGVRNKRRAHERSRETPTAGVPYMDHVTAEQGGQTVENRGPSYDVPTYEEAVGSGRYPVRQSNLRQSTSQLPSYEDLIAAVENEGAEPGTRPAEEAPPGDPPTSPSPAPAATADPQADPQADPPAGPAAVSSNPPTRSSSRASRILRPLRVRRIKSDKLHLKDFRLHIRSPTQNPVTIEPITPPPQYEDKMPELG